MKIETKFNKGEYVYFTSGHRIVSKEILNMTIIAYNENSYHVTYHFNDEDFGVSESYCYKNKQDLLANLI